MPNIWLETINGKHDLSLLFELVTQSVLIGQMHYHQLLIPLEQMSHGSFGNLDTSITQGLMNFRNTSMGGVAQRADQGNYVQPKLAVW